MTNLLSIPTKRSHPADIRTALRSYIHEKHPETHPDAFAWDISKWEQSRAAAVTEEVHEDRVPKIIAYHAQLVFALTKLPTDIGLSFTYDAMFTPGVTLSLTNIAYERLCILLNLASLFCRLATDQDRTTPDGIKRAVSCFAKSAATISYIISTALPAFLMTSDGSNRSLPLEFDEDILISLRSLVFAQGQECAWQKANLDQMKNGILAKLAAQASALYSESLQHITKTPSAMSYIPKAWTLHITAKVNHFDSVAQYRQSLDDNVARKYGLEVSRLTIAQDSVKKALDAAKRGGAKNVLDDAQHLDARVKKALTEAAKNNDLIYHETVTAPSSTPLIKGTQIIREDVIPGLLNPSAYLGVDSGKDLMFAGLEGWGITRACEIYNDRRDNWINEEVVELQHEYDKKESSTLAAIHLPAALDALSQPIGLPPSLLNKAEEIRREDGPVKLPRLLTDISTLSRKCYDIIDQCFDLLDHEAEEDQEIRRAIATHDVWTRAESSVANKELADELNRHNRMLVTAKKTDVRAQQKWTEWGEVIELLAQDQSAIEAAVPKTTYSPREAASSTTRTETQKQVAELRRLLDELDDLHIARARIVERAKRTAANDDIKPRILRHATGAAGKDQGWSDVDPAMFGDVIDEALSKYDGFKDDIVQNGQDMEDLLAVIQEQNTTFLESRKVDPSIKDREDALQRLELGYQEYRDIIRHLEAGLQFYNDFVEIASKLKVTTQDWVTERKNSVSWFKDMLEAPAQQDLDAEDDLVSSTPSVVTAKEVVPPVVPPATPAPSRGKGKSREIPSTPAPKPVVTAASSSSNVAPPGPYVGATSSKPPRRLPNPNSSAWQAEEIEPAPAAAPPQTPASTRKTRSRAKEAAR